MTEKQASTLIGITIGIIILLSIIIGELLK